MSAWGYEDIRMTADGQWAIEPSADVFDFVGVAIDTREMKRGQVFFAFVGEQVDGHEYLEAARQGGASMCVVSDASKVPDGFGIPVLVVVDLLKAITAMAAAWRAQLTAKVIGVTGSNGKTTTCRLIHSVCAQSGMSVVSQKSFNNELGVPITILNTPCEARYLVAELGTSSPGEIKARAKLLKPDIAVIVSIGRAHLEELGDRKGVAKEKAAIVSSLKSGSLVVIPGGDKELDRVIAKMNTDIRIARLDAERMRVVDASNVPVRFELDGVEFEVPMLGDHNAHNAAIAVMVGRELGIEDVLIHGALESVEPTQMRFERVEIQTKAEISRDSIVIFNDAYNANPDSMRAALATFDGLCGASSMIAILGDMLELGVQSDNEHRALVQELARYDSIDRIVLVGEALARAGLVTEYVCVKQFDDEAIARIAAMLAPGDQVLLKGSRGMRLERIIESLEGASQDA